MSSIPTLKPRLVQLVKNPVNPALFGFNVTATRSEDYRYVGIVVDNSLARKAGLRSGDRVHEVNHRNVDGMPLRKIQELIACGNSEVSLLVADPMTDQLYRENNERIRDGLPETICIRAAQEESNDLGDQTEIETEVVDADTFINANGHTDDDLPPPIPPPIVEDHKEVIVTPEVSTSPFKARLCTVKKWPDYQGFGFVLHGDKEEPGQTIGKVEPGSPAEAAGLHPGDVLVEVNGVNVEKQYQQEVVRRIANSPVSGVATMLVVDPDALRFFRGHNISVHSSMVDIERIETPPRALVPAVSPTAKVRLCHVKKWPDFPGYGFVLHGEKGTPGTYLTNIDSGSPAEAAGLQDGDRIVEINGVNVEGEEQPEAIARIQMGVDGDTAQTRLLVVDRESDRFYKRQNIHITGSMADVVYLTNADRTPAPIVLSDPTPEPEVSTRPSACKARLCILKKWPTFDGYGFYLHTDDDSPGIFIGKIDPDSPAQAAGLRRGDRIIEVNNSNVETDSQSTLVEKVVADPHQTRLLVVDHETYQYFLNNGVLVNGNMTDVDIFETPDSQEQQRTD